MIVVTGGEPSPKTCEKYDEETDMWSMMPDMNVGRWNHKSCSFNQKQLYVFCGWNDDSSFLNSIEKIYMGVADAKWIDLDVKKSDLGPRMDPGVVQFDLTHVVIFGGNNDTSALNDCYHLNTETNAICKKPNLPIKSFFYGECQKPVYDSETESIYAVGRHIK